MLFLGTHLQVRPVDGFLRMITETTRTRARMCLLWFCSHCSPFRGSKPPKKQFRGVNRCFQAKLAKSKNVNIIKTNQILHSYKDRQMPVVGGFDTHWHALQIQDGGRPPSWKYRKIAISWPRLERFLRNLAQLCSLTLLTAPTVKNLKFRKSKMAAAVILKKWKIAISPPWFERFWQNLAKWRSSTFVAFWSVTHWNF